MKIKSILGALLCLSASAAAANDCCPSGAISAPNDTIKQYEGTYSYLHSAQACIGDVCSSGRWGGSLDLSLLVWQAREDGLSFALKNNPRLTPNANLTDVNGSLRTIHFGWEPAYKINLLQLFANSWDFDARYTYFYTKSTASEHASTNVVTGSGLLPLWVLPQSEVAAPNVFGKARGVWNLHLNTADLELGYHSFLAKNLSLRLHAGLKGISINQRFTLNYSEGINNGSVTLLPSRATLRNRCLGLGPRFGFDSTWQLKKGWSVLADGAMSLTLSVFNLKRKDFDYASGAAYYIAESKFHESFYAYRPNFEGQLGFMWNTCYGCRKQYSFDFKAAYEVQYFWEQNMMRQMASQPISFSAFSMRGDLHCHGLTTTFGFGF